MGSALRIREQTHDALGWRWYEDLAQDVRYAVRAFRARAGFAASVILILALATGGATAIFSVINGVLLRPLPFADPDRLIQLFEQTALSPQGSAVLAPADVERIRRDVRRFSPSRFGVTARYIQDGDQRVRVMAADADRTLFDVLVARSKGGRSASMIRRTWRSCPSGSAASISPPVPQRSARHCSSTANRSLSSA
jgi:hypothetical protein